MATGQVCCQIVRQQAKEKSVFWFRSSFSDLRGGNINMLHTGQITLDVFNTVSCHIRILSEYFASHRIFKKIIGQPITLLYDLLEKSLGLINFPVEQADFSGHLRARQT